jgi:hypothetical protein
VIARKFSYELIVGRELMSEETLSHGLQHLTSSGLAASDGEIPNAVYTSSYTLVQDAAHDLHANVSGEPDCRSRNLTWFEVRCVDARPCLNRASRD